MQQSCQPQRRTSDLSLQQVALETLVYDELAHKAFCLNEVAATVWNLLDGVRTPAQLASAASVTLQYPVSEDVVLAALAQFEADGLLAASVAEPMFVEAGLLSRRRLMGGLAAGAVIMLPVVAAVMTPRAAQAYNGCVDCTPSQPGGGSVSSDKPAASKPPASSNSTPLFNDDVK